MTQWYERNDDDDDGDNDDPPTQDQCYDEGARMLSLLNVDVRVDSVKLNCYFLLENTLNIPIGNGY